MFAVDHLKDLWSGQKTDDQSDVVSPIQSGQWECTHPNPGKDTIMAPAFIPH